jgi:hypothetical protein
MFNYGVFTKSTVKVVLDGEPIKNQFPPKYTRMSCIIDGITYVSLEAKVYKYDHIIIYAAMRELDNLTIIESYKGINLSYENDLTCWQRAMILGSELKVLSEKPVVFAKGLKEQIINDYEDHVDIVEIGTTDQDTNVEILDPEKVFRYTFSEECVGKHTKLVGSLRSPDDDANDEIPKHAVFFVDPNDPWGPCEKGIV